MVAVLIIVIIDVKTIMAIIFEITVMFKMSVIYILAAVTICMDSLDQLI